MLDLEDKTRSGTGNRDSGAAVPSLASPAAGIAKQMLAADGGRPIA